MSFVLLETPGRPEFVRVARLAVAGTASCAGFSVEDIHELRQAVGEACSNAVTAAQKDGGTITVRCELTSEQITIDVAPVEFDPDSIKEDERTSFQYLLISTLMDDVQIATDGARRRALRMTRSIVR